MILPPVPDGTGLGQLLHLGGDHYAVVLCFKSLSHLLLAFCAFHHVLLLL